MTAAEALDRDRVLEADTRLGPLWVEKGAEVLTRSLLEDGSWDNTITGLMRNVLEPGMTFIDAGANIGWFSVLGSRLVGPAGRVVSVEPDPFNLTILRANLERHGCSNATVLPVAAWSEKTELHFHRPAEEGATARVGQNDGSGARVPADRLDELIEGPVDYLKIDCEHSDYVVVEGAEGLFQRNPSMLLSVEFHPWHESHLGKKPREILERYRSLDLRPYEIIVDGIRPTSWDRLADPDLANDHIAFDFVISRQGPAELRRRRVIPKRTWLEWGGDMLEYVPERIRPPVRHRDRRRLRAG